MRMLAIPQNDHTYLTKGRLCDWQLWSRYLGLILFELRALARHNQPSRWVLDSSPIVGHVDPESKLSSRYRTQIQLTEKAA